jgi:hypothetical protein
VRADTAATLKQFFTGKLPGVKAFGGRYKRLCDKTHLLIKADLVATEVKDAKGKVVIKAIPYIDDAGRYADFHSLRHTCGTLLAAANVHPKVAQSIMRHYDINLTMSRYTHTLTGQEAQAVESLADLSLPSQQKQQAAKTGADGEDVLAFLLGARGC